MSQNAGRWEGTFWTYDSCSVGRKLRPKRRHHHIRNRYRKRFGGKRTVEVQSERRTHEQVHSGVSLRFRDVRKRVFRLLGKRWLPKKVMIRKWQKYGTSSIIVNPVLLSGSTFAFRVPKPSAQALLGSFGQIPPEDVKRHRTSPVLIQARLAKKKDLATPRVPWRSPIQVV